MEQLAANLWVMRFPLRLLGVAIGRTVTIIRLAGEKLVVHSTGPFTPAAVAQIRALGEPAWLLDVSRFHDSFAKHGRAAFPQLPYFAPERFEKDSGVATAPLLPAPAEWRGALEIVELGGMPRVREHALFHQPSRTLIVADLLFNLGANQSTWARFVVRHILRLKNFSGMSPFFRLMIRDRAAFLWSIDAIMEWDFDRVIVGHGEVIERGGKLRLQQVLTAVGL